ncbi:MAG: VWA domain-containing protein [Alphaproteobacteria bacterium]|nr:VWA domain-containing protein [Alphaproteobacteria bacterium]
MNNFHFLRPEWFWGFLVLFLLPFFIRGGGNYGGLWQKLCDGILLRFQLISGTGRRLFWPFFLVTSAWTATLFSLAGPTWEKLPQPAVQKGSDTVYVMDISMLMSPTDIKPSRMERARFKAHDFLQKTKDGQNALILYDQKPFVAVPLTTDQHIIDNLLPTVRAGMMGSGMSDLPAALEEALSLLTQAKSAGGRVIVLSGHAADDQLPQLLKTAEKIKEAGHSLSFLGVGTKRGAPLQLPNGNFLTHQGRPVLSALSQKNMEKAARAGGGTYQTVTLDEKDIEAILDALPERTEQPLFAEQERAKADTWKDFGAVLCIFVLPFAAFGYRKGWLGIWLFAAALSPLQAHAWTFSDLWTRPDRREAMAIAAGETPHDPAVFNDPAWQGAAAYKAGDYPSAVSALNGAQDAENLYNQGNALAQAGQYRQAIETYQKVLEKMPDHEDAAFNKKYLEDQLKNNQQNQQKQQNQDQQKQNQNQQNQSDSQDQKQQDQKQRQQQQGQDQQKQQDQQRSDQDRQNQNQSDQDRRDQQQSRQNQQDQQQDQLKDQQDQRGGQEQAGSVQNQQKSNRKPQSEQKAPPEQKTDQDQERQEQMQWLSVIEDDPSGLLRERIRRHNLMNRRGR